MRPIPLLVLAGTLAVPAPALAADPNLRNARVTLDHGRAVVDVVTDLPDGDGTRLARGATNHSTLRFTVRDRAGESLARSGDAQRVPLDVPRNSHMEQTFRVKLGAAASRRLLDVSTVRVTATLRSTLDANGPAPGGASSSADTDTLGARVRSGELPSRWQFFRLTFDNQRALESDPCEGLYALANCEYTFDRPGTPTPFGVNREGTLSALPRAGVPEGNRNWSLSINAGGHEALLQGYTKSDYSSALLAITGGIVREWGSTAVRSGPYNSPERAGNPGGALSLDVESISAFFGQWRFSVDGYLRCEDVDCTIPPAVDADPPPD